MLNLFDSENISTKPSSPNHSIPGELPSKDPFQMSDLFDPMNIAQFEIEYEFFLSSLLTDKIKKVSSPKKRFFTMTMRRRNMLPCFLDSNVADSACDSLRIKCFV